MRTRWRGYSLPLVLIVLFALSMSLLALTDALAASSKITGSMVSRRKVLYACDGLVRGLSIKARDYFATTPTPTAAAAFQAMCEETCPTLETVDGKPPTCIATTCAAAANWFPDYTIEGVQTGTGSVNTLAEVTNGPFAGQSSRRTDLVLKVEMRHIASGRRCRVTQRMVNSQIGLFQFAVFSAIDIDILHPPPMRISGRTHINGNFCAGGGDSLTIERLTVSGNLTTGCFGGSVPGLPFTNTNSFRIVDREDPNASSPPQLTTANHSSVAGWRQRALDTWHKNALDSAHGVPFLRLPLTISAPIQSGFNMAGATVSNMGTLRIMLDPPGASGTADPPDVAAERLALKADIRIINGVWFKKTTPGVAGFPGQIIWSDHGAAAYAPLGDETAHGLMPSPVTGVAGPKAYSYYERDAGATTIANDNSVPSVVSYGAIREVSGVHRPAFDGATGTITDALLREAARVGFGDPRHARDGNANTQSGVMMPMNFDVSAFVTALQNTATGELGSHFSSTPFNGIVWITSTWPGVHNHYGSSTQVPSVDTNGATPMTGSRFTEVPRPLCGPPLTCTGTNQARVNAVRIINAASINPAVVPQGLTIATNLPIYTLGNVNTGSLVGGLGGTPGIPRKVNPSGPWVPLMLAGDAFTMMSKNFTDDTNGRRVDAIHTGTCAQAATETHVVAAIIAGHVSNTNTAWGGGVHNFPRLVECWSGVNARITGSLVVGFSSVFARDKYVLPSEVYSPPNRLWGFDPNFASPAHQPPGTPSFFVTAVENWDRD